MPVNFNIYLKPAKHVSKKLPLIQNYYCTYIVVWRAVRYYTAQLYYTKRKPGNAKLKGGFNGISTDFSPAVGYFTLNILFPFYRGNMRKRFIFCHLFVINVNFCFIPVLFMTVNYIVIIIS